MPDDGCEIWIPTGLRIQVRMKVYKSWRYRMSFGIDFSSANAVDLAKGCGGVIFDFNITQLGF